MDILTTHTKWMDQQTPGGHNEHHELNFINKTAVFLGVTVPFAGVIAAMVLLWGRGFTWLDLGLLLGMYSITVIGICVGYHRLFTHKALATNNFMKALLAIWGSMALQGPVIKWCAIHRRHHQVSDREGDPHSPHLHDDSVAGVLKAMWHAHIGWAFDPDPRDMSRSIKDLASDPVVRFIDKTFLFWFFMGLVIPTVIGGVVTQSWWGALHGFIWGGLVRIHLMHHATWSINSVCHIWGTRPYHSNDESRNNPIFGLVSFGEGWHNNHHAFPTSARHGLAWWQIDISWMFIRGMQLFGLAWDIRLPSQSALETKRRTAAPAAVASPSAAQDESMDQAA